ETTGTTSENSSVFTAWQPFQFGVMLWFQDTDQIWVLTSNRTTDNDSGDELATGSGTYTVYTDNFSGDGDSTASSGSCERAPVRGFGQVWSSLGGDSASIGCPLAGEIGYDTGGRVGSGSSVEFLGPGNTRYSINTGDNGWSTISYD
ncbi:MAG: hypothetical protein AAFR22_17945, partial [Chloroflexota bacterium]